MTNSKDNILDQSGTAGWAFFLHAADPLWFHEPKLA